MPPDKPRRLPGVSWDFVTGGQRRPAKRRVPIVDPTGMNAAALDKAYSSFYERIFSALAPKFQALGFAPRIKDRYTNEIAFATDYDRIHYRVGFWTPQRNEIHAYAWLAREHAEAFNQQIYRALQTQRLEINSELTAGFERTRPDWTFPTNDKDGYGSVGIGTVGSPDGSNRSLAEMQDWMLKSLPHVERVLAPRIAKIWRDLT